MDDYCLSDLQSLVREAERLETWSQSMTSEDWLSEVGLAYCESFAEVHLSFNQICANTSFPETPEAQATPEVRNPLQPLSLPRTLDTGEESSGHPSSAVSQDETVVRQRGHKRLTVTWSPDVNLKSTSLDSTDRAPPQVAPGLLSPQKVGENVCSSPSHSPIHEEQILLLPDKNNFNELSTNEKLKLTSPANRSTATKRPGTEKNQEADLSVPINLALKGLSHMQLINIIKNVISKHPEMEQEIRKHLSMPDLARLEERLNYFKSNIYKALPIARLTPKSDSAAYSSAAVHLGNFQKCVIGQGKTFMESQQWGSLVEYVFLAWSYVRATPVWDNKLQNATRTHCFIALVIFCMTALKNGSFDKDALVDIHNRLVKISKDTEEAKCCLVLIQSQMHNIFNTNL